MKLRREINIDLIGIDNTTHSGDIAAVHESIFHGTIMSIHEEDTESGFPREYEWSKLYVTEISNDELIASLGKYNDNEYDYLKFDNESQKKEEIKW